MRLKFEILFLLLLLFFTFQINIGTTISSPESLAAELVAPPDKPHEWGVQHWIPMKYRALFRWIVLGTYNFVLPEGGAGVFYLLFLFYSFLFLYLTLIVFYYYLKKPNFNDNFAMLGCIIFLLSQPILLAYKVPVHTREDVLAYFLVISGLLAILNKRTYLMCFIAVLAALTRENTLIVPLTYLLFTRYDSITKRLTVSSAPFIAFVSLRFILGYKPYNPVDALYVNLENPKETILFFCMSFGVLWILAIAQYLKAVTNKIENDFQMLVSSCGFVFFVVLFTNLIFAMVKENRILFMLFPWIIPLALSWTRKNKEKILDFAKKPILIAVTISVTLIFIGSALSLNESIFYGFLKGENRVWAITGGINLIFVYLFFVIDLQHKDKREIVIV